MARPSKDKQREDAKGDIIREAKALILIRGFDKTSVDEVIERSGLSKGTFYYYFRSKSELLDAIVDEMTQQGAASTIKAINVGNGSVIERFERFLDAARRWRLVTMPLEAQVLRTVFSPENSQLRERMRERSLCLAEPTLADLLAEGVREGVFDVEKPNCTARVILILAYGVSDDMYRDVMFSKLADDGLMEILTAKGRAFIRAVGALLNDIPIRLGGPDTKLLNDMVEILRGEHNTERKPE